MKKVLLASVAFAGFATAAAAEITLSGGGYVGVNGTTGSMAYDSRFQINVDGKAESDSGVSVAARIRIRSEEAGVAGISAPRIDVSASGLTVSMGNTDSAIRARSNPWASCVGNVGDFCGGSVFGGGFDSTGAGAMDRVRLDYAFGDWTASASGNIRGTEAMEIGVSGKVSNFGINVGYRTARGATVAAYAVDLNGSFGSVNAGLRYDGLVGATGVATLYGNTTFGATTVSAYVTNQTVTGWGLGVSHDLGGGIAVGAALSNGNAAQAHVSFSF